MSEDNDLDDRDNEGRFPLSIADKPKIERVIELVRDHLPSMSPGDLRAAASVLLALERLPAATPGVRVTFGFTQPNTDGNYGWVDIEISEDEFRLGVGEHFYDPSVGGDTETRTVFEAQAGGDWGEGDIDDWLPVANVIASEGRVSAEDYSEHDAIEWGAEGDRDPWQLERSESTPDLQPESKPSNKDAPTHDKLRRVFDDASAPMAEHVRAQLSYRHMIALADVFEGWALDERLTPEQSVRTIGWAESMRTLADAVGENWDPPEAERLSLIGFLGRKVLDE
jgi:hypothetical protein